MCGRGGGGLRGACGAGPGGRRSGRGGRGWGPGAEAGPGSPPLPLDANRRWTWMGKAYLLRVPEGGVYEVGLRWNRWWNNFDARPDVRPVRSIDDGSD